MNREIQTVIDRYPTVLQPDSVEPFVHGQGFSGAVIFKLICQCGEFCLRRWPSAGLAEQRIHGLHRLLKETNQKGVSQIAVPVETTDGSTLIPAHGHHWQMEPWMPGTADYCENPNTDRLRAAMRCLAQWHLAAAEFQPRPNEENWFARRADAVSPAVLERRARIGNFQQHGCAAIRRAIARSNGDQFASISQSVLHRFHELASKVAEELDSAVLPRMALQPCIRDVWHDHVLFTRDEVTGLIDLSACRTENIATDIARLVGSLVSDDTDAWATALDAYQELRPLTPNELRLVGILDRSAVLLNGMTWLERYYLKNIRLSDVGRVIDRLKHHLGRLDHLSSSMLG